jgi:hypothetical protein
MHVRKHHQTRAGAARPNAERHGVLQLQVAEVPDARVAVIASTFNGAIVERLVPLDAEQKRRVHQIARDTGWGQDADTAAGDELWRYWQRQKKSPEYAFLNAARTVHDLGFVPYDLDAPNMMQRASDGTVVVSDFGYSAPKAKTQARSIARLKNPRRRR